MAIWLGGVSASGKFSQIIGDSSARWFSFAADRKHIALTDEALRTIKTSSGPAHSVLAYTTQQRPVQAHFFPGTSNEYALVIGGMHGSELSSIEVAKAVIDSLSVSEKSYYNVVVIPALFPDNAALAARYPAEIGSTKNIGRYTSEHSADPNRQMPPLGTPFLQARPIDFAGRTIELENQALLHLICNLRPERIASIHAIRNTALAGIFADPRTDGFGFAQGFDADSMLAVQMARHIEQQGGSAPGNKLYETPSALYHSDPPVAPKGMLQKRTIQGGLSGHQRGFGISFGSWASTSERSYTDNDVRRPAAKVLTVEFPGSKRVMDYADDADRMQCRKNVQAYASAILSVMLQQADPLSE